MAISRSRFDSSPKNLGKSSRKAAASGGGVTSIVVQPLFVGVDLLLAPHHRMDTFEMTAESMTAVTQR